MGKIWLITNKKKRTLELKESLTDKEPCDGIKCILAIPLLKSYLNTINEKGFYLQVLLKMEVISLEAEMPIEARLDKGMSSNELLELLPTYQTKHIHWLTIPNTWHEANLLPH